VTKDYIAFIQMSTVNFMSKLAHNALIQECRYVSTG